MKEQKYKAFLIDSVNQSVTEVQAGGLEDYYRLMGCDMIEAGFYLPNGDCLYVDEEGLMKPIRSMFAFKGAHQPFVGNGLVVGTNPKTGDTVDAKSTLEEVKSQIVVNGVTF